jgi:hypothetical protein
MFLENVGQFATGARFLVRGADRTLWLAGDGMWITILKSPQDDGPRQGVHVKLSFVGANPQPVMEPFGALDTVVSYFMMDDPAVWRTDVPVWSGVRYREWYPGIDLEITSQDGRLTQRLAVHPGADLSAVRLRVEGAQSLNVDGEILWLRTAVGEYQLPLFELAGWKGGPATYTVGEGSYEVVRPFALPVAQPQTPLDLISFSDMHYSTFLGGSSEYPGGSGEVGVGIAVDGAGNAFVTGDTVSTDFPTTPGAFDETKSEDYFVDAFVAKVNPAGSDLVYATFLGGKRHDNGLSIAVDGEGNAYVTGRTHSSDFPTTPGAFDVSFNGGYIDDYAYSDAFVVKVNPAGTGLLYSTFLGGGMGYGAGDGGSGIAVDSEGNAYVTGGTNSLDFPTTPGAFDETVNDDYYSDAFVAKVNPAGSDLIYATFLGGVADDDGTDIAVDGEGNAYVTGWTHSSDFPTTPGAFDVTSNDSDAFVAKVNPAGSDLVYATFLGGMGLDSGYAIDMDGAGNAYVTGWTASTDFPTTPGGFNETKNDEYYSDVFVTKVNLTGSDLVYSTFLGGMNSDGGSDIAVDGAGNAYLTGWTKSTNYPTTPGAFDVTYNGANDAFVAKVNPAGSNLVYATYLGGSETNDIGDSGQGIAVDEAGNAYITGSTDSSDFPTTPGAFDTTFNGSDYSNDAFVTKLGFIGAPPPTQVFIPVALR